MAEPANRRMEAVRRHLLLPSPPPLRPNPLSSLAEVEPSPVIIGGMVLDIHAKPTVPPHPGTTVPGMVKYISGGVARNIAECMSKLGTQPFMISVVGNDMAGDFLLKYWRSAGLRTEGILQADDVATPVVSNVFDGSGELIAGVASVEAVENFITPSWIYRFRHHITNAPLVMLDANLPPESLKAACIKHTNFMKDQRKCKQTHFSRQLLEKMDGCFPLCGESSSRTCVFHLPAISASVISLTGAGDCLVGGVLSALCAGFDIIQSVAIGVAIAKASVESEANVPDDISAANIADDAQSVLHSAKVLWCK